MKATADSVMQEQSAFNEDTIKEWEAELVEYPFAFSLYQPSAKRVPEKTDAHCNSYDCSLNLLIC